MNAGLVEPIKNAAVNQRQVIEKGTFRSPPIPPTIHLRTMHDVRIEMAKVYRDMKVGRMPTQDGTRLVYVLSQIGRAIEAQVNEARIDAIEHVLRLRGNP